MRQASPSSSTRINTDADHFSESPARSQDDRWADMTESSDAESIAKSFYMHIQVSKRRSIRESGGGRMSAPRLPDTRPVIAPDANVPQGMLPTPVVTFRQLADGDGDSEGSNDWLDVDILESNEAPVAGESRMRGNEEWAPPRKQIIFHLHPHANKNKAKGLAKQNFRCAGCGLTVELNYVKRFRYCNYLGKYFCHSCHSNSTCVIPARVLWKWDFKKLPVSKFAGEFVTSIRNDPLYDLSAVNDGSLYGKVSLLNKSRSYRKQLGHFRDYLLVCRSGSALLEMLQAPYHLATEPDLYTLNEVRRARLFSLLTASLLMALACQSATVR